MLLLKAKATSLELTRGTCKHEAATALEYLCHRASEMSPHVRRDVMLALVDVYAEMPQWGLAAAAMDNFLTAFPHASDRERVKCIKYLDLAGEDERARAKLDELLATMLSKGRFASESPTPP